MSRQCTLVTHHAMEFVRKGRRLVERETYRLEVPVEVATARLSELEIAFLREGERPTTLYGHDGGLWRRAPKRTPADAHFEASLADGELLVAPVIAPALTAPRKGTKTGPAYAPDDRRIVSDDREARIEAAREAARRVMLVDGALWVRVREPQWLVRKADRPGESDLMLLTDIHEHWREHVVRDHMRFRLDRLPQAQAWARIMRGARAAEVAERGWGDIAAEIVAGPWGVGQVDFACFRGDDTVEFAKVHLRRLIEACAECIEAVPERLRRRWEDLRAIQDNLSGPKAHAAAEEGLGLVEDTLAMLTEVRDIPSERRTSLMRQIVRLRQNDRRSRLEGIAAAAAPDEVADEDMAALAP